jgi:ceramide glucosyltransferase
MVSITIMIFVFIILFGLGYQILLALVLKNEFYTNNSKFINNRNEFPKVSILKPLKGIDDNFKSNLESFFKLNYPNYEIIFGVHHSNDPAIGIVRKLQSQYKNIKAELVINNFQIGLNPKVNNLYNMYPFANGDYLLISDSNTQVDVDFLNQMIDEFNDNNIGLVTATIRGLGAKTFSSLLENIHLNSFLTPTILAASKLKKISIVVGKAILIPNSLLDKIGGFEVFKEYLAEDYIMGKKVEEMGYKIKTSSVVVNNINQQWSLRKFLNRHSRWAKMRAKIQLSTYFLESFSNPISASCIFGLVLHNKFGLIQFFAVIILKSLVDYSILRIIKSDIKFYQILAIPIKDLIIGLLWFIPFLNSSVNWRNNKFKIKKYSHLQPILSE